MRIGITCYPTFGGSGVVATELGKALARNGHEVHFIAYAAPQRLAHVEERIYFHEVNVTSYPLFKYPPYSLALTSKMVDAVLYEDEWLFHVCTECGGGFVGGESRPDGYLTGEFRWRHLNAPVYILAIGGVLHGLSGFLIGAVDLTYVAATLTGAAAGWAIVGLLAVFSLARGLCSVAHKDVIGKTIPKTRRGRLNGLSAAVSGGLALLVGVLLLVPGTASDGDATFYGGLVAAAGCAWLFAASLFASVREEAGATDGGDNALREAVERLQLLRTDRAFARFVTVRALFLVSALSAPYYVVLANDAAGADALSLGLFIIAGGLASALSAPVWGRMADASSKTVMLRAALIASALGVAVVAWTLLAPERLDSPWVYAAAFLVLGIAHSGVRLGRKTYIIDMAGGDKRTDYVAVSNSVIGVILLATGLIGALASVISPAGVILVFAALGFTGVALGRGLRDV